MVVLGILLFLLMSTNLGITGLVPKYMSTFFPTEIRSAEIGFIYHFAVIGGAVPLIIVVALSERIRLGQALLNVTLILDNLVFLVGLRITERIQTTFSMHRNKV